MRYGQKKEVPNMNSIKTLATFLGWCTIINFGFLLLGLLGWVLVIPYTSQLFASIITPHEVKVAFFNGLMIYRSGIVFFNLVPYIALKIMDRA
jgi:hypothetical protein